MKYDRLVDEIIRWEFLRMKRLNYQGEMSLKSKHRFDSPPPFSFKSTDSFVFTFQTMMRFSPDELITFNGKWFYQWRDEIECRNSNQCPMRKAEMFSHLSYQGYHPKADRHDSIETTRQKFVSFFFVQKRNDALFVVMLSNLSDCIFKDKMGIWNCFAWGIFHDNTTYIIRWNSDQKWREDIHQSSSIFWYFKEFRAC